MAEQPIIIKKIKGHGHAHHGGSWKVAYADFMTAMMAFFMVMWLLGLSDETRTLIQGYFNDPLGFAKSEPKSKTLITIPGIPSAAKSGKTDKQGGDAFHLQRQESMEINSIASAIKQQIESDKDLKALLKGVRIEVTPEGLMIELAEIKGAVFFESGSAVIRPLAQKLIDRMAPVLAKTGHPMIAQGHTDAQPMPGDLGNMGLSTLRAASLARELMTHGVADSSIKRIEGLGATKLLDPEHPNSFANRRVTILIPRLYQPGDKEPLPSESLRTQIQETSNPQAVEIRPQTPAIAGTPKH